MAPAAFLGTPSGNQMRQISNYLSSSLKSRSSQSSPTPLASIFALLGKQVISLAYRAVEYVSHTSLVSSRAPLSAAPLKLDKRENGQGAMLAIPTTYAGLNSGPSPGAVVGIMLGSIGGFLLVLFLFLMVLRLSGRFSTTIVEEEVIRRRSRSPRRSRSRSEVIEVRSEHRSAVSPAPSRRRERDTIVVEERISRVDPPPQDDIVEVIEEHSPERRPPRRESKRMSGFRTVDPAEFGGGDRPMRRVSKR